MTNVDIVTGTGYVYPSNADSGSYSVVINLLIEETYSGDFPNCTQRSQEL